MTDCDFCGDPIDGPVHEPHNRDCPQTGDCQCDNQVCAADCWGCNEEATT